MYIADRDIGKIKQYLSVIATESRKEKQRKHKIENYSNRILSLLKRAERKNQQTLF